MEVVAVEVEVELMVVEVELMVVAVAVEVAVERRWPAHKLSPCTKATMHLVTSLNIHNLNYIVLSDCSHQFKLMQ